VSEDLPISDNRTPLVETALIPVTTPSQPLCALTMMMMMMTYVDLMVFKMAAVRHLEFEKVKILTVAV